MEISFETYGIDEGANMIMLFYQSIESLDTSTTEGIDWKPMDIDIERWNNRIEDNYCIAAKNGDKITGFGEISSTGHIDMLFVMKEYHGHQIGKRLVEHLEHHVQSKGLQAVTADAGTVLKPFYEHLGYSVEGKNIVTIHDVEFENYIMKKQF